MGDMLPFSAEMRKLKFADELHGIATKVRSMSQAEHMYESFVQQSTDAAKHGAMEVSLPFWKKTRFGMMYDAMKQAAGEMPMDRDAYIEDMYKAQYDFAELVKAEGFTVDIKERSSLILMNEEPQDRSAQYIEADVVIKW